MKKRKFKPSANTRQSIRKMARAGSLAITLASGVTQAALHDRGAGLVYDDVLDVTWLADANYAKTSGYDADGLMTWSEANTWAADLIYGGYYDWRLATNTPVVDGWQYGFSFDGSTDSGYNVTSPHSELSYMYFVNLGFKGRYSPSGLFQSDSGIFGDGTIGGERDNLGPNGVIDNLQSGEYWYATGYMPNQNIGWWFSTALGAQGYYGHGSYYAWAVHPGDVASVPEPVSAALFSAGLFLMVVMGRPGITTKNRGRCSSIC